MARIREEPMFVPFLQPSRADEETHGEPYFSSIVASLTAQLAAEKRAYAELEHSSTARIATLEASVAHRDAELESYIQTTCTCHAPAPSRVPPHAHPPASSSRAQPPTASMTLTKVEALEVQEQTATRNRVLEVEVNRLAHKLEQAQTSGPSSHKPSLPNAPQKPGFSVANHFASSSRHGAAPHVPQGHLTNTVLSAIDQQLESVGREADGFQAERDNLAAASEACGTHHTIETQGRAYEEFKGVLLIEEECIRLRRSERMLRQQLMLARATATATEQELRSLVERLQWQVNELRNTDDGLALGEADMELEDDMPNRETLEPEDITVRPIASPTLSPRAFTAPLQPATPSQPSWVRPVTEDTFTPRLPPPSSRPPGAQPFPTHHPVPSQSAARLARIESELQQARDEVERKDRSIEALRAQLGSLETAIQARTKSGA